MNNKGFTLVEVISIVVILSLLLVLTAPTYSSVSDNIKERNWASKKSVIEKQTIEFVNNYMKDDTYNYDGDDSTEDSKKLCFSAGFLIRNGIITSEDEKKEIIVNDVTKDEYTEDTIVIAITYDESSRKLISYTITDNLSGTNITSSWFSSSCNTTYK